MLSATRTKVLLAGVSAAALIILAANPAVEISRAFFAEPATPVDELVTGAITTAPPAAPAVIPPPVAVDLPVAPTNRHEADKKTGSEAFRTALELVTTGDRAGAYALAKTLPDAVERRAVQWAAVYYGNGDVPAASVVAFQKDAPGFATSPVFKTRLEQALTREKADGATLIELLGGAVPDTISAQIALAQAYVAAGETKRAKALAKTIWTENFLDAKTEERVLDQFGDLLDNAAHWQRAMHLMMHDRATAVERLFKFMNPAQKSLAEARNATSRNAKNAKKLLDAVDPSMRSNPVYLFSRAQRARQFELWDDAIRYLNKVKGTPVDADQFWYERRTLARQLLALGEVKRAYKAVDGYREGSEGRLVEAHFHAGWIALSFLKDAKAAAPHFEEMLKHSTLPDSVTQANYWLGRARKELGDSSGATEAFEAAAKYGTVYYGQLAREALGKPSTEIRSMPEWREVEPTFESNELVKAVRLLADNGHKDMAVPLLRSFANDFKTGSELLLAARLAQSLDAHHLTIAIADTSEKRGFPLDLLNFPKDGLPATKLASVDVAAIYAIARQESRFQVDAVSSAGARGLMQLMPATAEETAGKIGIDYSKSRLTSDAEYNALLGSTYLKAQLERFDGSLVLAAAAYNAGGGNANKWVKLFGDPRSKDVDPVVWVELIPMLETRNYVKRVVGNYLVYRARLGKDDLSISDVLRRIPG